MADNSTLTPKEMTRVLEHLVGAYPRYFNVDEKVMSKVATSYYYFLSDYGRNDVWNVACKLIRENDTAPTIHAFIKELDKIEKYRDMGVDIYNA